MARSKKCNIPTTTSITKISNKREERFEGDLKEVIIDRKREKIVKMGPIMGY